MRKKNSKPSLGALLDEWERKDWREEQNMDHEGEGPGREEG